MDFRPGLTAAAVALAGCSLAPATTPTPTPALTMAQVLEQSTPADWRQPDPENTLYLELKSGRVVIELAPEFAPNHVANIRTLVREKYFDGLAIVRVHENYVVQWGDADDKKLLGSGKASLPGEYFRPIGELPFTAMPDGDVYAPQAGYTDGFPAGRDPARGTTWLA
ncbi:MAG: peptidylprolyl isomerase, partial [Burkholderiaceae bacterium]